MSWNIDYRPKEVKNLFNLDYAEATLIFRKKQQVKTALIKTIKGQKFTDIEIFFNNRRISLSCIRGKLILENMYDANKLFFSSNVAMYDFDIRHIFNDIIYLRNGKHRYFTAFKGQICHFKEPNTITLKTTGKKILSTAIVLDEELLECILECCLIIFDQKI